MANNTIDTSALSAAFKEVRDDMTNRTSRVMVVAAGRIVKAEAKRIAVANGSKRTGAMIKNIAFKFEKDAPQGTTQYNVGVRHGSSLSGKAKSNAKLKVNGKGRIIKVYVDDPYYWSWVEFGHRFLPKSFNGNTSVRARRKAVATSFASPKPFLAPALVNVQQAAIDAMEVALVKALEKQGGSS